MTTRDTCASCTLMTPKAMYFFVEAASWKRRTLEIRFIEAPITNREQQTGERTFLVADLAGFLPHSVQKYARPSIPRTRATSVALGQPTVVRRPAIGEPPSRTRITRYSVPRVVLVLRSPSGAAEGGPLSAGFDPARS